MLQEILDTQFLHPHRHNQEQLRQMGYAFVDLIVDQVLAKSEQAFVKEESPLPPLTIPAEPTSTANLILEIQSQILPRALNLQNSRYMGHMDSVPAAISIWADALTAALNNNMLSYELAPVFTQLEAQLVEWFGQLFGLGEDCFGTLVAGGTLANITALLVARNQKQPQSKLKGNHANLVAFVSEAAHNSFDKGMNTIGLGSKNLIKLPTDERGAVLLEDLEKLIQQSIAEGKKPFFIAAIAGTTITGAIDNVRGIEAIARKYDCWFHIDAAYGGAAIFSSQWQHLLAGCELADSITFNPQKWMWVSRTCAMLLVKHKQALLSTFDRDLPYMSDERLHFGTLNLQGTRRTDSLKLWLTLRALGTSGYGQLIERSMEKAHQFKTWIENSSDAELVCEPTVNIVCLRSTNSKVDSTLLRQRWIDDNKLWLSLPLWKGERILKAVVLHPYASW